MSYDYLDTKILPPGFPAYIINVVGTMGSGKSRSIKNAIKFWIMVGYDVVVLDIHREYEGEGNQVGIKNEYINKEFIQEFVKSEAQYIDKVLDYYKEGISKQVRQKWIKDNSMSRTQEQQISRAISLIDGVVDKPTVSELLEKRNYCKIAFNPDLFKHYLIMLLNELNYYYVCKNNGLILIIEESEKQIIELAASSWIDLLYQSRKKMVYPAIVSHSELNISSDIITINYDRGERIFHNMKRL